ncbi:hypothetical protein B4N89_02460 [Embleya scabrispora]|uniref:Uncharacterized protein n=1 Tax=Embleya scabrispora TaxID=159449 RepID=A0A1T3NTE9_9ACTN|nr:hypothetical protein [Embleya scabrispora]OPC79960.1 hypothetical protein B4N89_02460 [Embleya scabrispora]
MTDPSTRAKWQRHVRRQAVGLTPEQITHRLRGVRAWNRNGVNPKDTTSYSAVGARCSVAEWERIAALVAETGAETYDPVVDPIVQQDSIANRDRRAEAIVSSLTSAELAAGEDVLRRLRSIQPVPPEWTARHVALTIRLDRAQRGTPPADLACIGTCDICGRAGQQIRETPGAWICTDSTACGAAGGYDA